MATSCVLVTGASGFIGRWSVPALHRRGYAVHVVLSRAPTAARPVPEELLGATVHVADLLDDITVHELFREIRPTHLLHFAWNATPGHYWTTRDNYRWVEASLNLVRTFHEVGGARVVAAGTCAEYDWTRVQVCHETRSPLATDGDQIASPYATCKSALQKMLATYGRHEGLSTAWGRIFFQYGPYENPARLVSSVICNLLQGRPALTSHGRQVRSFLHVADVGEAFAALLDSTVEGPVNIGGDVHHTVGEVLDAIAKETGRPDLLRLGERPAAGEPPVLVPDVNRLYHDVGWRPRFTLSSGIADTVAWWRQQLRSRSTDG